MGSCTNPPYSANILNLLQCSIKKAVRRKIKSFIHTQILRQLPRRYRRQSCIHVRPDSHAICAILNFKRKPLRITPRSRETKYPYSHIYARKIVRPFRHSKTHQTLFNSTFMSNGNNTRTSRRSGSLLLLCSTRKQARRQIR